MADVIGNLVPGNLPLQMRRGSRFGPITIECKDALGVTFNLTGYLVFGVARRELSSSDTYDLEPTISLPATGGEIVIDFSPEETMRLFPAGEYTYDVVLETPSGDRGSPLLAGRLTVIDENTRPNG